MRQKRVVLDSFSIVLRRAAYRLCVCESEGMKHVMSAYERGGEREREREGGAVLVHC